MSIWQNRNGSSTISCRGKPNARKMSNSPTRTAFLPDVLTPTVRKPIAKLPSGKAVFGMADVVVLNDPITGQGSNNASKCAKIYLDAIIAQGDKPYDEAWMQATFDQLLGLRAVRDRLDQCLDAAAAAARSQHLRGRAELSDSSPAASPIASASRWICFPGSPCPKKPTSISSLWRRNARKFATKISSTCGQRTPGCSRAIPARPRCR